MDDVLMGQNGLTDAQWKQMPCPLEQEKQPDSQKKIT